MHLSVLDLPLRIEKARSVSDRKGMGSKKRDAFLLGEWGEKMALFRAARAHGGHVFAALQRMPFKVCMLSCAHTTQEVVLLTPRQHANVERHTL